MIAPMSQEEMGFMSNINVEKLRKERLIKRLPFIDFKF